MQSLAFGVLSATMMGLVAYFSGAPVGASIGIGVFMLPIMGFGYRGQMRRLVGDSPENGFELRSQTKEVLRKPLFWSLVFLQLVAIGFGLVSTGAAQVAAGLVFAGAGVAIIVMMRA